MAEPAPALPPRGASFLLDDAPVPDVFTPDDFSDEHRMIAQTTAEFVEKEVVPKAAALESKDWSLTVDLMRKAGELGLLGIEIPEKYGGLGLDSVCAMLVAEKLAPVASFAVTYGGHTGIGTLPIVYFGTDVQRAKYLPRLAKAEMISAYALTEASSGSDALSAKAAAVLSPDKKYYVLNGEKMWITNAGFADLYIVFAKIDGKEFSCFLVEAESPGLSTGKDEPKMGLEGSSTRALILQDVKVPVENLVGEIGKGHKVALNILNTGRFKLGAGCIGGAKVAFADALKYAGERKAFGKSIADFGAIQHKLGEMAIRTWVGESMVYRTGGLLRDSIHRVDPNDARALLKAIEEYAVECSILKVACSEILDYVVDEGVQIYGGYGYSREYAMERYYRDARINRIFEGTNEINRLTITGMLMRKTQRGELPLAAAARKASESVLDLGGSESTAGGILGPEVELVSRGKKTTLVLAGAAVQALGERLNDAQEVTCAISDLVLLTYAMDSALLRARKRKAAGRSADRETDIVRVFVRDALARMECIGRDLLAAVFDGDVLRTHLGALRRLTRFEPVNSVAIRRGLAAACRDGSFRF